ncbi:MAG: hypothetical protein WCE30_25880 [Mycobacterium sp.]
MKWVARTAATLVALQLVLRAVLAFSGYFYWDDLILIGKAGTHSLLSTDFLFNDHDGHVMPGGFLLAGVITRSAPLNWFWPALSLVVLQLAGSLALLRALRVILGWRPVLLVPLTFALFTPLGVPAFAWWSAGLNALPMAAAMAWVCADAILLVRTGNQRYVWTGLVAYLGGLLFFEKSAVIPFVAFAVCWLLAYVTGTGSVKTVWRGGLRLWLAMLTTTIGWVGVYVLVVNQQRWTLDLGMTWELLARSVTHGLVPTLAGGPWEWQRWAPASPWATPTLATMMLGWLVLAALVAVSVLRKRRLGRVWLTAVGYVVACQVPIYLMRSSRFTALELAQTLRYLSDLVVVLALLAAVAFCAPNRAQSGWLDASARRRVVVACLAVGFTGSSLYSWATFLPSWRDNPTRQYLMNVQDALAGAPRNVPLLDQEVDPMVMQRVAWPENMASHMFALLRDRPEFSSSTTSLQMFTAAGQLVPAKVTWVRTIAPGPAPHCGYLVQTDQPVTMPLDGPLLPADWTAEINYLANNDGSMTMSLTEGHEARVPVHPGLNRVFVRLSGAGNTIRVRANTAALSVCVASGPVGFLAPR